MDQLVENEIGLPQDGQSSWVGPLVHVNASDSLSSDHLQQQLIAEQAIHKFQNKELKDFESPITALQYFVSAHLGEKTFQTEPEEQSLI